MTAVNRHSARILALQGLYQYEMRGISKEKLRSFLWVDDFNINEETKDYAYFLIEGVINNKSKIESIIEKYLNNRKINDVEIIDRVILFISVYSLLFLTDTPYKVIINEAVVLAKDFSNTNSYKFINGILDAIKENELQ